MSKRYIIVCAVITMVFAVVNAASSSKSCVMVNNQVKCTSQEDPNGNTAVAAGVASSDGRGMVGAGAGTPNNMNTDFKQIGQGTHNNGGAAGLARPFNPFFPRLGQENYGNDEVAVRAGEGNRFNPNVPQYGKPFPFVQDYFRRLQ